MAPLRVGVLGCGNICGIYFKNLATYPETQVVACADLDPAKAEKAATEHGVRALTPEQLLAADDVDLVLNLTIPAVHGELALQAVRAGKHVYNEKPLCIEREEAKQLLAAAEAAGVRVGCAPDTFLGAGLQTCRKLIDDGAIGEPVAIHGWMMGWGPEGWHPNPSFFYQRGGGPMLDMGPYYVTAMVSLFGPIRSVSGNARITFPKRPIPLSNGAYYGENPPAEPHLMDVSVPTHYCGVFEFASGALGELTTSFDTAAWLGLPNIVALGSEGAILVPDPNTFGGPVKLAKKGAGFEEVEITHPYAENSRGLGVRDIALALAENRPHRASGALAYHVLDVMHAVADAGEQGKRIDLEPGVQPSPMEG